MKTYEDLCMIACSLAGCTPAPIVATLAELQREILEEKEPTPPPDWWQEKFIGLADASMVLQQDLELAELQRDSARAEVDLITLMNQHLEREVAQLQERELVMAHNRRVAELEFTSRINKLNLAVKHAEETFLRYAEMHDAKGPAGAEKAAANRSMAEGMRLAMEGSPGVYDRSQEQEPEGEDCNHAETCGFCRARKFQLERALDQLSAAGHGEIGLVISDMTEELHEMNREKRELQEKLAVAEREEGDTRRLYYESVDSSDSRCFERDEFRQRHEGYLAILAHQFNNDAGEDPVKIACQEIMAAIHYLPEVFDTEDFCFSAAVKQLVDNQADLQAADKEIARLRECLEPGRAPAIMQGLFQEATRLGFYKLTGKHALTQFVEEIERLREERAVLQSQVDNADVNWKQQKMCTDSVRAQFVAAKKGVLLLCEAAGLSAPHMGPEHYDHEIAERAETIHSNLIFLRREVEKLKTRAGTWKEVAIDESTDLRAELAAARKERQTLIEYIQKAQADAMIDITDGEAELWREVVSFFERAKEIWAENVWNLQSKLAQHEQDLKDAATDLMVPMPEPGSQDAKMMHANVMMRHQRDVARRERDQLREERDTLKKQLELRGSQQPTKPMTTEEQEIEFQKRIKNVIVEQLGIREDQYSSTAGLMEDFGADSLDVVELQMGLEDEFEVEFSDEAFEEFMKPRQPEDATVEDLQNFLRPLVEAARSE